MEIIYLLLGGIALILECSKKVNTNNLFKKSALLMIMLGSILSYGNIPNHLIPIGSFAYIFISNAPIFLGRDRRKESRTFKDKRINNGNI